MTTTTAANPTLKKLEQLYKKSYQPLTGFAFLFVSSRETAEEIVQDVFLLTINKAKRDHVFVIVDVEKYIKKAIVNRSRDYHRKSFLRKEKIEDLKSSQVESENQPTYPSSENDSIDRAISMLPRAQRECIILRYFEDMKLSDIAETLSISEGSVKSHLHRASIAIKDALNTLEREDA